MKKFIIGATLIAISAVFVKLANGDKIYRDGRNMTVLIQSNSLEGNIGGSGILLDEKHVLTCAHMVDKEAGPEQVFLIYTYPLGNVIKAHVDAFNSQKDIAILVLEDSATIKTTPFFEVHTEPGDNVTLIGNAMGAMQWLVTKGIIEGYHNGAIVSDAAIQHGNSGGPWLNDNGDIVGMSDWMIQPKEGAVISGAVSAKDILDFLEAYKHRNDLQDILSALSGGK